MDDNDYMGLAIEQAKKAADIDEVPVGAIIVNADGQVIGQGYNCPIFANDPTSHAEINAIRMAGRTLQNYRLTDTTLYTTIEPCIMCMGAIVHARIRRVVYGAPDPKWGAVASLYAMAEDSRLNHHPDITSGVQKNTATALMKQFFINKRSK